MIVTQITKPDVTLNFKTLYSTLVDTCYQFIRDGYVDYKVKDIQFESGTDTECIHEIDNSIFISVSKECLEFCDSKGLSKILADYLIRVKEIFSNILGLTAELDYFREDENKNTEHVVVRIEIKSTQQIAFEEYDKIVSWIAENITSDKSGCL